MDLAHTLLQTVARMKNGESDTYINGLAISYYFSQAITRIHHRTFKIYKFSPHMHLPTVTVVASAANTTVPALALVPYNQVQPSQWGPEVISSLVFGCIMVCIGAVGLWQGYLFLSCKSIPIPISSLPPKDPRNLLIISLRS